MDIRLSNAYLSRMSARLVTLFSIVLIAVVTMVASAHAARMNLTTGPDHASHLSEMIHSTEIGQPACGEKHNCGSADKAMCNMVCAGLSAFLIPNGTVATHPYSAATHAVPSDANHIVNVPGLNERPPQLRLF
ncbi:MULTISPECIES: hypothetical protein [Roseobacteraceae]|uniref:hypothetical protein n=1 Tax=Roseobacteraceae TaxID=2854170 RepID=UPI00125FE605|nr:MULTISPECIES: hypothetical protein [Roseobacteraceae]KAB6714699.1 hypothetical protein C8029_18940 [Roseobacter sp. TSBP12]